MNETPSFPELTNRLLNERFVLWLMIPLLIMGCDSTGSAGTVAPNPEPNTTPVTEAPATDVWLSLLGKKAYPYNTPLPPPTPTILDGTYQKFEPKKETPIPCRRCPDYMAEGGTWKLNFDKGTFRIFHEPTGWQGLGAFSISGDRLILFNDPKCPDRVGTYTWKVDGDHLLLKTVEDTCAADLRGHNLEKMPWERQLES